MNQRQSELDQFLSYLQNERHYSAKTVLAYQTDLHEAERFWHENGGFPGWTKVR
ncbi:MAG: site-specific integrase, partial [Lactobacillus crispatus]|nr:site-specific integrase [Lactobacillus crispatus]MCT7862851.1 site-specific integrase [Lactobacillus crispatus]